MYHKLIGITIILALILVLAVVPLISACAPEEEVTPPPTGPTGELVVLFTDLGSEVWGNNVGGGVDDYIRGFTNERLMLAPLEGEKPEYNPGLAESWKMSADGLTWDFYLRKGIQFQEGWGEFTAEDVLFSFLQIGEPGSTNGSAELLRVGGGVEKYEIVNPYHFRMKLLIPTGRMGWMMSIGDTSILSKKYYEAVGYDYAILHPIGTSPWRLIEHVPAEYLKYEAEENHWRQTPAFKYLTVKCVPEESTRKAMMKTGVADICQILAEDKAEMEAAGLKIKSVPGAGILDLQLGGLVLPTREHYDPTCPWVMHQDEAESYYDFKAGKIVEGSEWNTRALKVRMAMFHAINYDAIIDKVFYDEAVRHQLFQWTPTGSVFTRSLTDWPVTPYDPVRARELLAEAGYPNGFELEFQIMAMAQQPKLVEISLAVAMDLEAIGLTVNRYMTEYVVVRPDWCGRDSAGRVLLRVFYNPDPTIGLGYCNNTRNDAYLDGYESLEFNSYIDKMESTIDYDEHIAAVKEAGDFLIKRFVCAPVCINSRVFALNSDKVAEYTVVQPPFTYEFGGYEYVTKP